VATRMSRLRRPDRSFRSSRFGNPVRTSWLRQLDIRSDISRAAPKRRETRSLHRRPARPDRESELRYLRSQIVAVTSNQQAVRAEADVASCRMPIAKGSSAVPGSPRRMIRTTVPQWPAEASDAPAGHFLSHRIEVGDVTGNIGTDHGVAIELSVTSACSDPVAGTLTCAARLQHRVQGLRQRVMVEMLQQQVVLRAALPPP